MMVRHSIRCTVVLMVFLILVLGPSSLSAQDSPKVRTLTEQEMIDMMVGSSIQASRSSNSARMIERVKEAFADGKVFTMIGLSDLPDDWTIASLVTVGGGGAWEYVRERTTQQNLPIVPDRAVRAVRALSRHLGKEIDAVIRFEPAGATLSTFMAASELGIPVVDACLAGRAVPEIQMQTSVVKGVMSPPGAAVSRWGDTVIIDETVDDYRVEDLSRALAVASGGVVSMAYNTMSGEQLKKVVIADNVSQSILFGRTVREAVEQGKDPIDALVKVANGHELFHGIVTKADMKGDGGFTWWDVELRGTDDYAGHTYKVFVKNENLVAWLDGEPDAMAPDLICNLNPRTGDTIVGPSLGGYPMGEEVVMISIPAAPIWRTPEGVEILGPRHFGFDFDYVPVEKLQSQ